MPSDAGLRPLPELDDDNRPFWTGGEQGRLLITACTACASLIHPPCSYCPECGGRDVEPRAVSGRGTVYSFTVNHKTWFPGLPGPYVVALVELAEDRRVRITTNLVGSDPGSVAIGMAVECCFERCEDVWLPLFRPVAEEG